MNESLIRTHSGHCLYLLQYLSVALIFLVVFVCGFEVTLVINVICLNIIHQLVFAMGMQNSYCETGTQVRCVTELS